MKLLSNKSNNKTTKNDQEFDENLNNVYHEKQVKELCAVHALNNLFQENFFSKTILDDICVEYFYIF